VERVRVAANGARGPDHGARADGVNSAPLEAVAERGGRGTEGEPLEPRETEERDGIGDAEEGALVVAVLAPPGFPDEHCTHVSVLPIVDDGGRDRLDPSRWSLDRDPEGVLVEGIWRFDGLAPGLWRASARLRADARTATGSSERALVLAGAEVGPLAVSVTEYLVDLRVVDLSGEPVPAMSVGFTGRGAGWRAGTVRASNSLGTDAEGRLRLQVDGPSMLEIRVPAIADGENVQSRWTRTVSKVLITDEAPVQELEVRIARTSRLAGRISFPGDVAVAALRVHVLDDTATTRTADTDEGGYFVLGELRPGDAIVHGVAVDASGEAWSLWRTVDLRPAERREVEWQVEAARAITGTVVDADGAPAAGVVVAATPAVAPGMRSTATTDAGGRLELPRLHPCIYELRPGGSPDAAPTRVDLSARSGATDVGRLALER
ncbi:MAG: carboxypeptidase regulatory-like domain-containing protein, partial [Planctomycetota bacterium]